MASRRDYALAVKMTFDGSQAQTGLRKTHLQLQRMQASAQLMKQGFSDISQGMTNLSIVGLASAGTAALATKRYADFADQMAAVRSVFLGELPEKQFKQMSKLAEHLGATTRFTATQAAAAMENLARAGMSPIQVMKAVRPVMAAAAAENMDLASAADIVASNLKAFQLPATQAARVADALAFVSAKTNTNMLQLQEGLKFTAAQAKFAKIPLEDTVATLGILADVGLKGSIGGTALKNAIIKLSQNAKNGIVPLGKYQVAIAKNKEGGLDLARTFTRVTHTLGRIPEPLDRVKAAMKLFGIRGANAAAGFNALVKESDKLKKAGKQTKMDVLFNNMRKSAAGAAQTMRQLRLNTIKGDFILLGSAVDGVAQAFGKALAPSIRSALGEGGKGGLIGTLSAAAAAFQHFSDQPEQIWKKGVPKIKGVKASMVSMVQGVLRGVEDVRQMFTKLGHSIRDTMQLFGLLDRDGSGSSARLMVKVMGITAGVAALGIALKGATFLFGGVATAAVGTFKVVVGGFGALKAAILFTSGSLMKLGGVSAWASAKMAALSAVGWGGAALAVAKFAGGIAIAGAAGYGLGRMLDRWTGASSKLAKWMSAAYGAVTGRASAAQAATSKRLKAGRAKDIVMDLIRVQELSKMQGISRATVAFRKDPNKRYNVTAELAIRRVQMQLSRDGIHRGSQEFNRIMRELMPEIQKLKSEQEIKVNVQMDGKNVASAVAKVRQENQTRGVKEKGKMSSHKRLATVGHVKK